MSDLPDLSALPDHMSPGVRRAWDGYLAALEEARRFIFSRDYCNREEVREQAGQYLMQVQAAAYSWVLAPRVDYPRFHLGLLEPMAWNWGLPSPDFRYRWAFVDGSQTYRIWGRRGGARFLDIQLMPALGSLPKDVFRRTPGVSHPVDQMHREADGSFEIVASPEPHAGNWIRLDPAQPRIAMLVREAFYDWANDKPSLLRIERTGPGPARPLRFDEAAMIDHIEQASRFVTYVIEDWGVGGFERNRRFQNGVMNIFGTPPPLGAAGTNPAAANITMVYEIGPDDALIIEWDRPASKYWSFCIADRYFQLADFTYHQSSLNGHQARIDSDGRYRAVLSRRDPGVPNWLDPVETVPLGAVQFRQFFQDRTVDPPKVTKVPFAEVRERLPEDTPAVTPEARAEQLRERAWACLALYGY